MGYGPLLEPDAGGTGSVTVRPAPKYATARISRHDGHCHRSRQGIGKAITELFAERNARICPDLPRGCRELAARYGLSDELAGRLAAIDVITDAVVKPR
jgi:hypothetical protein